MSIPFSVFGTGWPLAVGITAEWDSAGVIIGKLAIIALLVVSERVLRRG